jgi:hypothetical protein
MIVKLVRENTAYYIREDKLVDLYSRTVNKNRIMTLSEIAIDLDTDKVLKSCVDVEAVFDQYVAGVNREEREAGKPYVIIDTEEVVA